MIEIGNHKTRVSEGHLISVNVVKVVIAAALISASTGSLPAYAGGQPLNILAPDLPGSSEAGGVGRDAEMVSAVLRECGYQSEFIVQPFGRHMVTYKQSDWSDAVMTVPLPEKVPGYSTSAYTWYQNGVFYNPERAGHIRSIEDLKGLNVVTFKHGLEMMDLGPAASSLGWVYEHVNQEIHSRLLFLGRVDAVLADGLIVATVNRRLREAGKLPEDEVVAERFSFAPIFTPLPVKMVFRRKELAISFEQCLDRLYADGTVNEINERYFSALEEELGHRYLGY